MAHVPHVTGARDAARPLLTDCGKRQTLAAAWFTRRTIQRRARGALHWNPGLLVPHALRFQQERSVTPLCVQHGRAVSPLHKQDWCVLRFIQPPCSHGTWKKKKPLPNSDTAVSTFDFSHWSVTDE